MLTAIYLLTISFGNLPLAPIWNPYGPIEFSSYQDCLSAGETLATWMILKEDYTIACANKSTGEVNATWGTGPINRR